MSGVSPRGLQLRVSLLSRLGVCRRVSCLLLSEVLLSLVLGSGSVVSGGGVVRGEPDRQVA